MITRMRMMAVIGVVVLTTGCSSVRVKRLDPKDPDGVPFYLSMPICKVTTTTYKFLQANKAIDTATLTEREIIEVIDTSQGYTVNHTRPFAGESKLALERGTSSDIKKVSTEDKEGLTEFLKGLVEGGKQLTEALAAAAEKAAAAPAGYADQSEATYFNKLWDTQEILVVKTSETKFQSLSACMK